MYPTSVALRLAGAALLAVLPASVYGAGPDWSARYEVRFGPSTERPPRTDVDATLRWIGPVGSAPSSLDVGMAEDGFPKGYGAFVRDFKLAAAAGAPPGQASPGVTIFSAEKGRYRLAVQPGGVVRFSYSVCLEHDATDWGWGPDEAPYRFDEGTVWTGRALFITAPRSAVVVSFTAPDGDRLVTSFEPVTGSVASVFSVPDEQRLRDCFLVVGRPATVDLQVGRARVTLAVGAQLKASLPMLSGTFSRFLEASAALFGGAPPARVLVVGNIGGPKGSFNGGVFGPDVSFLVDQPLTSANAGRWQPFLCHELFHLWNGRALDYEGQEYWMSEGFTEYYAQILLLRLGSLSSGDFTADMERRMSLYFLAQRADLGLHAAGESKLENRALVYEGGSLAALCLDLQIRAATSNQKSLDDVMRLLYAESGGEPRRMVSIADVIRVTSHIGGRALGDFFARHVAGSQPLPLSESLRHAGIHATVVVRDLPDTEWIADLLRCPSMGVIPGIGIEISRSKGELLRERDVLLEVEGTPTKTFDDLRVAFGDWAPGASYGMTVMRDGRETPLRFTPPEEPWKAPSRSRRASVSLEMTTPPDPLTLAIRRSIFGARPPSVETR